MARITLSRDEYITLRDRHYGVRAAYSGRGMYGDTCLAYTGEDLPSFLYDLAEVLEERDSYPDEADVRDRMERIGEGSSDSMGRGVVHYWQSIQVEDALELMDDDD